MPGAQDMWAKQDTLGSPATVGLLITTLRSSILAPEAVGNAGVWRGGRCTLRLPAGDTGSLGTVLRHCDCVAAFQD